MEKKVFICSRNDDVHCALSWDFLFSKQSDQKYYNRNWNYSRYIKSKIDNKFVYKIESGKCIIWSDHLDSARNFYIFWCEISFINDSARLIFLSTVSRYVLLWDALLFSFYSIEMFIIPTKEKWKKIITSLQPTNDGNHDWTVLRICHNIFELQYILLHIATTTYKNRSPKFH